MNDGFCKSIGCFVPLEQFVTVSSRVVIVVVAELVNYFSVSLDLSFSCNVADLISFVSLTVA